MLPAKFILFEMIFKIEYFYMISPSFNFFPIRFDFFLLFFFYFGNFLIDIFFFPISSLNIKLVRNIDY